MVTIISNFDINSMGLNLLYVTPTSSCSILLSNSFTWLSCSFFSSFILCSRRWVVVGCCRSSHVVGNFQSSNIGLPGFSFSLDGYMLSPRNSLDISLCTVSSSTRTDRTMI
uniref:Uncharacterized protein n=1 Tax=Cacopsylla melanoneura TaxID=428564 RepID=A0A8D9FBF4_9HEMI